jgi:DNA-binding MarR family transcriptional regulator
MRTVVSRTRVSRIVAELEARGLVERAVDPNDARASVVTITAAGRQELRRAAPVYLKGIDDHFSRYLSSAQRNAVAAALQRVVDAHADQIDPRR